MQAWHSMTIFEGTNVHKLVLLWRFIKFLNRLHTEWFSEGVQFGARRQAWTKTCSGTNRIEEDFVHSRWSILKLRYIPSSFQSMSAAAYLRTKNGCILRQKPYHKMKNRHTYLNYFLKTGALWSTRLGQNQDYTLKFMYDMNGKRRIFLKWTNFFSVFLYQPC